ncbi:MAG: hypothetical protein Q7T35_07395, partial [Nitrosomonas sp.]|nr:hypothetical protein [Nitrosomonas sp.]
SHKMSTLTSSMKHFLTIVCIDKNEGEEFFSLGGAYNKVNNGLKVRKRVFEALIANLIKYSALCIFHFKEILIKLIASMVRQDSCERNQYITVLPEPVEGLNQSFLNESSVYCYHSIWLSQL